MGFKCLVLGRQAGTFGGRQLRKLLWFSILLSLVLGTVYAAPVSCLPSTPGTVTTVVGSLPGSSLLTITCGAVTFSNFQAIDASGGTTMGLPVNYLPGLSNSYYDPATGFYQLSFNPNFTSSAGIQDIHFFFDVTSTVPIRSVDMSVGGSLGAGSINENVCNGGTVNMNLGSGVCTNGAAQLANLTVPFSSSGSVNFFAPPGTSVQFGVWKNVGKQSGELTSFTQSFTTVVPEPATYGMLGGALVLLAAIRRMRS